MSASLRGVAAIVLGVIARHNQMKDGQTGQFIREGSNLVGLGPKLAEEAELNVNTLYRTLSPKGNPELKSLKALLRAMGMQLTVRPLRKRVA